MSASAHAVPRCAPPRAAKSSLTRLPRRWGVLPPRPFFACRPALLVPLSNGLHVALCRPLDRLLPTPPEVTQPPTDVVAIGAHAKGTSDHLGHPRGRPDVPAEPVRFRSLS